MDLGYDGTDFHGWARQPGLRTVEGTLEEALRTVLRLDEPPQLTVAGRTDAGVHARHQVAHVDVPEPAWAAAGHRLVDRLRGVLPDDVRVATVQVAPLGFDARFSAIWRRYTYRLCDIPGGADPLRRHEAVHHRHRLDVDAMNAAGEALLGEHDFLAFCRPREGATTVRELRELTWWREGELVVGRVLADAFCHHMVRALVGALVAVGDGRRPVEWPGAVLAAGARDSAVTVMPAHGLVLEAVGYPRDDLLAARALESRRLRETGRVARSAADA